MKLVGGIGVPHTPHFPAIVDHDADGADALRRLYGDLRRQLESMAPDVIVFFSSDHYNLFFAESIPIFSVGVADSAWGPSDYDLQRYEVPLDASLADTLQERLVSARFDVGRTRDFELDHPFTIPLHFLVPAMDIPIVPFWISAFMRPLPSARRCVALGHAIRTILEAIEDDRRVVVIGTGSFSLEIGGPRMSPVSHTGVPAPRWVDRIMELMTRADLETLMAEATDEQMWEAGNAGGEVLLWLTMLATLPGPPRPAFLEAQPEFGHGYGAWAPAHSLV
jgi:aromatic ring-opening dioxygenase catalytic subunit (LigB family)